MSVLVGKKAPEFSAPAVVNGGEILENFSLKQYEGKKYVVFFFYPADFTFVCPTEIVAMQDKMAEFEKRNVAVVGASPISSLVTGNGFRPRKKMVELKGLNFLWWPTVQ
jgi:peroxiredoxin (alkyl hydroperoxide reductase subunit C)